MTQASYSDGSYHARNPSWHVDDSEWKAAQILRMLERNRLNCGSICEVGCGAGEILRQLQEGLPKACEFDGYEVSPQALQLCQGRSNDRLRFHLGSRPPTSHDLICVIDVIEHLEDYFSFLRDLGRKCRHMILHIPLDLSANHLLRGTPLMDIRAAVGHLHYFSPETAVAAVQDCGFEIVDRFYTAWSLERRQKSLRRKLVYYPKRVLYAVNANLAVKLFGGFSLLVLAQSKHVQNRSQSNAGTDSELVSAITPSELTAPI